MAAATTKTSGKAAKAPSRTSRKAQARLLQGNEAASLGALAAGCNFFAGYPITPASEITEYMSRELPVRGRAFHSDGGRDRLHRGLRGGLTGRAQGHDRHQRPGFFPDAGKPGLRLHCRDAPGGGQCDARRPQHGTAHQCGPGRRAAGPLGHPRRPPGNRVLPQFGERVL